MPFDDDIPPFSQQPSQPAAIPPIPKYILPETSSNEVIKPEPEPEPQTMFPAFIEEVAKEIISKRPLKMSDAHNLCTKYSQLITTSYNSGSHPNSVAEKILKYERL